MPLKAKYLSNICNDTATLAVIGRASYLNCQCVSDFFNSIIENGLKEIVIDCQYCTGMDSTFLGVITSAILKLRKVSGNVVLTNLSQRNQELVDNIGISKLAKIDNSASDSLKCETQSESIPLKAVEVEEVLNAHKTLIEALPENYKKFEDVISFLEKDVARKQGL